MLQIVPRYRQSFFLVIGIHAGPPLNVGNSADRRLDLVRVIPLELQQLGPLGRVRHLDQEVIEDLDGGVLADVCMSKKEYI